MNTPRRKNYWLPPKGASEFFLPSADDEFKSKHPVGYRFLVLLGATVLILPMMIYGIIVSIHLGKESSIWLLLGGVGSFLIGIGLFNIVAIASIDKGTRGSAGRKCPHTASKPLRIHKVFSAAFSLSASISAPAELLRIGQPWIFEGFLFFWTQAGCRPPRTKGQKAPKRLAVRRVCSC